MRIPGDLFLLANPNPFCAACTPPFLLAVILAIIVTFLTSKISKAPMDVTKPEPRLRPEPNRESPKLRAGDEFLSFPKVWIGSLLSLLCYPSDAMRSSISSPWWHHHTTVPLGRFCDCSEVTLSLRTKTQRSGCHGGGRSKAYSVSYSKSARSFHVS